MAEREARLDARGGSKRGTTARSVSTSGTSTSATNSASAGAHKQPWRRRERRTVRAHAGTSSALEQPRSSVVRPVEADRRAFLDRRRAFVLAAPPELAERRVDAVQPLAAEEEAARRRGRRSAPSSASRAGAASPGGCRRSPRAVGEIARVDVELLAVRQHDRDVRRRAPRARQQVGLADEARR